MKHKDAGYDTRMAEEHKVTKRKDMKEYNQTIESIYNEAVTFNPDHGREYIDIVRSTGRIPDTVLVDIDGFGFFAAPASAKHHLAVSGGLFLHSLNVIESLMKLSDGYRCMWSNGQVSIVIVGLLHDLCKCELYSPDRDNPGKYVKNEHPRFPGHGVASLAYASLLGIRLNADEAAAISGHMGAFDDKDAYDNAIRIAPMQAILTHTADMIASQVVER